MLLVNIIFAVSFIPIWPILYFIIRNNKEPKKNIIIGTTLPQSVHKDAGVQEIVSSFKKWLNIAMLPLLPLMIPPFFMSTMGAAMTWFMVWLLLLIVLPFAVFAVHRGKLMELKRENNWYSEAANHTLADVKAASMPVRKINGIWFLPPVVISLFPIVYMIAESAARETAIVYITFAILTAAFWLCYHLIFRLRSEILNENLTLTMALTHVRRYNWGKFWLIATWATGILNLLILLLGVDTTAFLVIVLGYSVLLIGVSIYTEFSTRIAQQKLTAGDTGELYLDEDDHWIWGILYYNPNNNHFLVNDRIGMNMSFNLAKPAAAIIMGLGLLCLVAMPFFGIWMWMEETTPPKLVICETELIARHTSDLYVIPLADIDTVELTGELPYILTRNNGAGFENLNKGRFTLLDYGSAFLCVRAQDPPFLIITAGGKTYLLNDAESAVTQEVYALIS